MAQKVKDSLISALKLFSIFFYVAIFTVGGGIAMLPVLERTLVDKKSWLNEKDFLELFSLTQVLPGSFMIHMATFIGYRIENFLGAIFCGIAIALPPLIIITTISHFYTKFIQFALIKKLVLGILCGVAGEITGIIIRMSRKIRFDVPKVFLLLFSFLLMFILKVNPIYVVITGGILGIILIKETE
jgi:chromate transporter